MTTYLAWQTTDKASADAYVAAANVYCQSIYGEDFIDATAWPQQNSDMLWLVPVLAPPQLMGDPPGSGIEPEDLAQARVNASFMPDSSL